MKKASPQRLILYDFIYITFLKGQKHGMKDRLEGLEGEEKGMKMVLKRKEVL